MSTSTREKLLSEFPTMYGSTIETIWYYGAYLVRLIIAIYIK